MKRIISRLCPNSCNHFIPPKQQKRRPTVVHTVFIFYVLFLFVMSSDSDTYFLSSTMRGAPQDPAAADEAALVIPMQMTVPWRNNGRRCISTALQPAYYAVYIYEIEVDDSTANEPQLRLHVQALGEYDLAHPEQSLFGIFRAQEEWEDVARQERKATSARHSRFIRATWTPTYQSPGYHSGFYTLPWPNLRASIGTVRRLQFAYGRTSPWQTSAGFPVVTLLEFCIARAGESITCPRTKAPVDPKSPWAPVFPTDVEDRFRQREQERERAKQQQQQEQ